MHNDGGYADYRHIPCVASPHTLNLPTIPGNLPTLTYDTRSIIIILHIFATYGIASRHQQHILFGMTTPDNRYVHQINQTTGFPATKTSHSQGDNARHTTEAIRPTFQDQRKQTATQAENTLDGYAEREAQWRTHLANVMSEKEALHLYVAHLKQEIAGYHQQAESLRSDLMRKGGASEEKAMSTAVAPVKQERHPSNGEPAELLAEPVAWAEEKATLAPGVEAPQARLETDGKPYRNALERTGMEKADAQARGKWEGKAEGVRLQDEVESLSNGMDDSRAKELQSLRDELKRSRQPHDDISRQLSETRAALQHERTARQQLAAEVDRLNKAHAEDRRELDDAELLSKWVRGEYERMRKSEEEARKEVESLKTTVVELQAQIASARDGTVEVSTTVVEQ